MLPPERLGELDRCDERFDLIPGQSATVLPPASGSRARAALTLSRWSAMEYSTSPGFSVRSVRCSDLRSSSPSCGPVLTRPRWRLPLSGPPARRRRVPGGPAAEREEHVQRAQPGRAVPLRVRDHPQQRGLPPRDRRPGPRHVPVRAGLAARERDAAEAAQGSGGTGLPGVHGAPACSSFFSKAGRRCSRTALSRSRTTANSFSAISRLRRWVGVGP